MHYSIVTEKLQNIINIIILSTNSTTKNVGEIALSL